MQMRHWSWELKNEVPKPKAISKPLIFACRCRKGTETTQALNLIGCNTELPEIIVELVHLRYLNLSNNRKLKELPTQRDKNSCGTCKPWDLFTCLNMKITWYSLGQLINLWYIFMLPYNYNLMWWPKEIGRLSCPRTLNGFKYFGRYDAKNNERNLGALRNLNSLQQLCIHRLGDAEDHVDEAKRAQLSQHERPPPQRTILFQ